MAKGCKRQKVVVGEDVQSYAVTSPPSAKNMQQTYHLGSFLSDDTIIIYDPNAKIKVFSWYSKQTKTFSFFQWHSHSKQPVHLMLNPFLGKIKCSENIAARKCLAETWEMDRNPGRA